MHEERKMLTLFLSLIDATHGSWFRRLQTQKRFGLLKISQSSWMKGGVTMATSKNYRGLVLMLLLLVRMLTMSI